MLFPVMNKNVKNTRRYQQQCLLNATVKDSSQQNSANYRAFSVIGRARILLSRKNMQRLRKGPRIASLRRRAIARIAAGCLVILGVLPFSAPFKTFDFAAHDSHCPEGNLPKDKADCGDDSVDVTDESLIPPPLKAVFVAVFACSSQCDSHPLLSTVLRV
jgi:hypothetical protein